ncbi:hypothetical protein [Cohnella yongneupensis]|uniref:NurA domain-containing protein n=1 Tax=Cohnella yongneupensis TaxID=425006 RepID=A0ABW0R3D7_9BACL
MNKKDAGISRYIDSIVLATDLTKGIDFEVASFVVMDDYYDVFSLGGFLGTSSNKILLTTKSNLLHRVKESIKNEDQLLIAETPFPKHNNQAFFKIHGRIDIDLATELGLGVVKMNGEYMLYFPFSKGNPSDAILEMLLLKVYFQLLHPLELDEKLKLTLEKNEDLIITYLKIDGRKHVNRLKEIFSQHN